MPLKIDTHCHVTTTSDTACDAMLDQLERAMDEQGIGAAVVMPLALKGFDAERELERLVTHVASRKRLRPMLCYDAASGERCTATVLELLGETSVVGVKFFTGYDAYSPLGSALVPLLDVIEKLGKVAKFHTGATARTERSHLRFCNDPYIFDDLAASRPNLKIDCAHFMAPNHIAMAPVLDNHKNIFADLSGLVDSYTDDTTNPYAGFVRYRLADALAYLLDVKQLHFGSDFPFCNQGEMIAFVSSFFDEYGFGTEHRHAIWHENAAELYGIAHD